MKCAAILLLLAVSLDANATPVHESPRWYVAEVSTGGHRELYGPWRAQAKAQTFCAAIPATVGKCEARAIMPAREWDRKGAR